MRFLKLITVVGLILAVSGTAGAATAGHIPFTHPWQGPVFCHLTNDDSGNVYQPVDVNGVVIPNGVAVHVNGGIASDGFVYASLVKNVANGLMPGEDAWGVYEIDNIYEGYIAPSGQIEAQNEHNPLFVDGFQGKELVGIFYDRVDNSVVFNTDGSQTIASSGDKYAMYIQDQGVFDDGYAGSSGRNADGSYTSVGDDPSSVLVMNGYGQINFFFDQGDMVGGASLGYLPEVIAQFYPDGSFPGHVDGYINLWEQADLDAGIVPEGILGGDNGPPDPENAGFNGNYFVGDNYAPWVPTQYADWYLHATTDANNGNNMSATDWYNQWTGNEPGFEEWWRTFDWTVTSSDSLRGYVIPEPVTMLGLFLGVGSLAGYIRKRRMA